MGANRSSGVTNSERILARFTGRSFLSLWSYPNLYRAPDKELCDVLVVFDDHVIIFSDKLCEFPEVALDLAWQRWHRRAIGKSIDQLLGAERWLRQYPDRVFLDRGCTERFPLPIPPSPKIHLVCIANGATERCKLELGEASGSLVQVAGETRGKPFLVNILQAGRVIHLLDEFTCPIVFGELDTAPDFIAYLSAKEELILGGRFSISCGEENTLAAYLMGAGQRLRPGFPTVEGLERHRAAFLTDLWGGLESQDNYQRLKERNRLSAAWDETIELIAREAIAEDMVQGNERGLAGHEERLRVLARTSRAERYQLSMILAGFLASPRPDGQFVLRAVQLNLRPDTIYAFAVVPESADPTHEQYRTRRRNILEAYCVSIKAAHPEVIHVVGIATEPPRADGRHSEDVGYLDARGWGPAEQAHAERTRRETGLYQQKNVVRLQENEYAALHLMPWQSRTRERNKNKRLRRERRKK